MCIRDSFDSPKKDEQTKAHWQAVFGGKPPHTVLDVSIGTGGLTLPLSELGVCLLYTSSPTIRTSPAACSSPPVLAA